MVEKDLEVIGKGVKGKKNDEPFIDLKAPDGSKIKIMLGDVASLDAFEIGAIWTAKINKNQTTLDENQNRF